MARDSALQDELDRDTQQGLWEPMPLEFNDSVVDSVFWGSEPVDDFIETELKKPGKWVKRGIGEVYVTEDDK